MSEIHWSKLYLNFITVEVVYKDGAVQTWDYDCEQYPSLLAVRDNMADDFSFERENWESVTVHAQRRDASTSFEVDDLELMGSEFSGYVFDVLGEAVWQLVEVS